MDGVGHDSGNRLLVLGATNLPWELDPAIRRRFERRIYIPLPEVDTRYSLFKKLCEKTPNTLNDEHFRDLAERTEGYSGSDISTLVKDAVYEPLRISQKARKFRKSKNEKGQEAWLPVPPSENIAGAVYF